MGYANTTMVVYGIKLSDFETKKIVEALKPVCDAGCGVYLESLSSYGIELFSEDTDSRIHDLSYEPGHSHVFGINYCSNGYAVEDDIVAGIRNIPQKVIDDYNQYAKEFLKTLDINGKPDVLLIDQVH